MKSSAGPGWFDRLDAWGDDREAVLWKGHSYSYRAISHEVARAMERLGELDIKSGELVGLLAPPSLAGFVLIHALLDRGGVMVPLNPRWTQVELRQAMTSARIGWLAVSGETLELGERLVSGTDCGLVRLVSEGGNESRMDLLRARVAEDSSPRRESMKARDAALVLFTSGTSGRPKGALLSRRNLYASAEASIELLGSDVSDRWLCCMPLFHIGGLSILVRSAIAGTSVVLHSGFDARAVDASLNEDAVTRVSFVATMLSRVLEVRGNAPAPAALTLVLLGGGPAPRSLLARARELGYPVAPTYGLTEAASQVATRTPETDVDSGGELSESLHPLPGTRIRIVSKSGDLDPDGSHQRDRRLLDVGEVGEIEVKGPTVMQGYLDDEGGTQRVLRNGWLSTGDLGLIDSKGGLHVLDRRSDLIVSGGENVYPAEVESVLVEHPDVEDAGVVGFDDPTLGSRPRAFVVAARDRTLDISDLREFCARRLAKYKLPTEWVVVDELPRGAGGKLLRRELREQRSGPDTTSSA